MRAKFMILLILCTAIEAFGANGDGNWPAIAGYRAEFDQLKDVDSLGTGDPVVVWDFFERFYWQYQFNPQWKETIRKAGVAVGNNRGVQAMIEKRLQPVERKFQTEADDLLILGGIPAPWSARILGRYLMDPTPMEPRKGNYDVGTMSNEGYAAWGLSAMNFPGAPTQGAMPLNIGLKLQAWKDWWVANEAHIEDRIREINPEWEPEEVSTQAAESTPKLPVLPSPTQKPMPTATPGIAKSLAQESASPTLIIVIILVAAVGVGIWIYTRGGDRRS